jgi:glucose/arabinose dehydrogenase
MRLATLLLALLPAASPALAADPPTESDYYRIAPYAIPEGVVLEVGALEWLPGGKLAVATRRGEIYVLDRPLANDPKTATFSKFADGLHEVLGLAYRDGRLYAVQRGEITRLQDEDGDGRADLFETVGDSWEITGNYHEYAFGSKFDRDGNLWVALCLTGSFSSDALFRGWALRLTPDGKLLPTTSGLRSPGGLGMNAEGDMFFTENQGPWNGACALKHLKPGAFVGHPIGNKWYPQANIGPRPADPRSGSRMATEAKRIPELLPPAVYFPYAKMGQSASGIACDLSGGKFGPFENQLFVCDQSASTVMRASLEKVNGRYQGACFPFRQGFASGNLALLQAPNGSLIVGGTNRGWGSRGPRAFALERLDWTGKIPFEVRTLSARPDGFELTFTEPLELKSAIDPKSYALKTYTYIYQESYGSPEVDETTPTIRGVDLSADGKSLRLSVDGLAEGHVHEFHLDGLRSASGLPLLHREAYYTMNAIPGAAEK